MAHSYLIYQRILDETLEAEINADIQSRRAKACLDLNMLGMGDDPDNVVARAIDCHLHQPTMFMIGMGEPDRDTLEHIFAEGNDMGGEHSPLGVEHICKHPNLSVGDLVVGLSGTKSVHVCMPMGWHEFYNYRLLLIGE